MLTMTAPIGRRRISAAIAASVGRRARRGSWRGLGLGLGGRRRALGFGARCGGGGHAKGGWREVLAALDALGQHGFEGHGAAQAAGDAGDDERDVGGAEGFGEEPEVRGGGAFMGGGDELLADADESADDVEDAAEAGERGWGVPRWIGVDGLGWGVCGGRHERT